MIDPSLIYPLIGKEITRLRKIKKLTQTDLAKAVSLTRTSITNIEKGRQKILVNTLWDLAEQLGVHPSKLIPAKINAPLSPKDRLDNTKGLSESDRKWIETFIDKEGKTK